MILIISAENDTVTNQICANLTFYKKKFIRIHENRSITDVFFDFTCNKFDFVINEEDRYKLNDIRCVFYRNSTITFKNFHLEVDSRIGQFYKSELTSIINFIYYYLHKNCDKIYGNLMVRNVNKLEVLNLAQLLGFKIPETYILSNSNNINLLDPNTSYITKSISEMAPIYHNSDLYLNYTRLVSMAEINNEEKMIPSLLQSKIDVEYEIRVFFFEKKIWSIAMFDFEKNIDVRNVQSKKYIPYELPSHVCKNIFDLADGLKLNCGTIDLLKSGTDFYFLEVNPLGQFQDVNYWGNYNIDQYIARLL